MKDYRTAVLFELYKNLLTKKQSECFELYYNEDLSLSEISENLGITRQGVRDNIKRTENALFELEEKAGILKILNLVSKELECIKEKASLELKKDIQALKDKIDDLDF